MKPVCQTSVPGWMIAMLLSLSIAACTPAEHGSPAASVMRFPANNATDVNPDTHLKLTFERPPAIGTSGLIEIIDTATGEVVDTLDMSIPASPRPTGRSSEATQEERVALGRNSVMSDYQVNTIGGLEFHFFPIIVHDTSATIYPHNNKLDYGHTYSVRIDPDVLKTTDDSFAGFDEANSWTFTTKASRPDPADGNVTVSADGKADFNTVQGAIDFAPAASETPFEISIRNGRYEEIVYLADKQNLILRGESRDSVQVGYPNNSSFNPPREGPSRRPAFSIQSAADIQLSDFTINNYFIGQAEALLINGDRIVIDNMQLNGSGDALTTYGTIYMVDSELVGHGDTILGYASLNCLRCTVKTHGPFTWTRTPQGQHGNIFVDSELIYMDQPLPWTVTPENPDGQKASGVLARLPFNGPKTGPRHDRSNFPFAEMVLINTKTDGIPPEGWGPVEPESEVFSWDNIHLWEFNTMDMAGNPVDLSSRHPLVRVLNETDDADLIRDYSDPAFVLGGWIPTIQ